MISLFKDDCLSGNERKYYNGLTERFLQSDYLVYPNIALQAIFRSELREDLNQTSEWIPLLELNYDERNFFDTSSVDLCVIERKDYQPLFALEIDGETHANARQVKKDDLKDHIFNLAGLPLRRIATCPLQPRQNRLPFRESDGNQPDSDAGLLRDAIRQLNDEYEHNRRMQNVTKTKSLLLGIKESFDFLNEMLPPDQYIVFPNMALQSIFGAEGKTQLGTGPEGRSLMTSLLDFCLASASDVRPVIAFSINRDEIKEKILKHFGLPLLYLPRLKPDQSASRTSTKDQSDSRL